MSQSNIQPLNNTVHANTKIKATKNFAHVKDQHMVPVVVQEFSSAGAEFPVVFVKNSDNNDFQPVVLFGLKPGENLYANDDTWQASYVPSVLTNFPFALVPHRDDSEKLMVLIATDNNTVNEQEGQPLFNDDGQETEYMSKRKEALVRFYEHSHMTKAFTKELVERDLLVAQNLNVDVNGEKIQINGLYIVNEKKLNEMADEEFVTLRQRGMLGPIYSHLTSVHQIRRLAQKKAALAVA
ncbi:SapC family protein [Thalassotalea ponticola]|uniref:SapC family protein n=1 Tax=Thalassotalea ponticola TaxID=1523392 RepID=UPI0025B4CA86|nr:SapC family protein [Thalassotalea ponticola]MDN3653231.1 SapC family protein [Thalassotalea ponticola]